MFSNKNKDAPPAPPAMAVPQAQAKRIRPLSAPSIISADMVISGTVRSTGDIQIDGRVEGTIELRDHTLTIGPDAHIQADIVAKMVTVFGVVVGTITAKEAVDIRETGSVEGNITSRRLTMADGAVVRGHVDTGGSPAGEQPDREPQLKAGQSAQTQKLK